MADISLKFDGPFSFVGKSDSVFHSSFAISSGIYLWTIRQQKDKTHLIHYIGETTSLVKRHREHLINILGLNYGIFDAGKAQQGVCKLAWKGLWRDKTADGPTRQLEAYETFHGDVMRYISILNIFFAELDVDSRLRKHVEGCIGRNLRNNHPEYKVLYPDDNRIGIMKEKNHGELLISSTERIQGLDSRILY